MVGFHFHQPLQPLLTSKIYVITEVAGPLWSVDHLGILLHCCLLFAQSELHSTLEKYKKNELHFGWLENKKKIFYYAHLSTVRLTPPTFILSIILVGPIYPWWNLLISFFMYKLSFEFKFFQWLITQCPTLAKYIMIFISFYAVFVSL